MLNNQRAIPCFLVRIETCFDVFYGLFVVRPFQWQQPKNFSDQSLWPSIRWPFLSCGNWIRSSNWHRICSGTRIFSAHRLTAPSVHHWLDLLTSHRIGKVFHSFSRMLVWWYLLHISRFPTVLSFFYWLLPSETAAKLRRWPERSLPCVCYRLMGIPNITTLARLDDYFHLEMAYSQGQC